MPTDAPLAALLEVIDKVDAFNRELVGRKALREAAAAVREAMERIALRDRQTPTGDEREAVARWADKKADTLESLGRTRVPPTNYAVSVRRLRRIAEMLRGNSELDGPVPAGRTRIEMDSEEYERMRDALGSDWEWRGLVRMRFNDYRCEFEVQR